MPNPRDERNRILDMLAEGKITAEQAAEILKAIGPNPAPPPPPPPHPARVPVAAAAGGSDTGRAYVTPKQGIARMLRISIDAESDDGSGPAKIRVNVPLALARFAMKFMPEEARDQLDDQGIDLAELLEALGDELPEGRIVDIDAGGRDGGKAAKIIIEVV